MTKTDNNRVKVKILLMERHFLYLPLYLAAYDCPQKNKQPFYGKVPSHYDIELKVLPSRNGNSDAAVFDALMDARIGSSEYMFAACDPTVLIVRPDKNALMIASLISSSAFWAINHKRDNVRLVSDLSSFDKIICYGEKTTSNLIARRIVKSNIDKLQEVRPRDEIGILTELRDGELVITPEVLDVANLLYAELGPGQKRCEIVLELSTTKEFSNVLTTALFTRSEILEKHQELVSGLLTALQLALNAIQGEQEIVADCVQYNYRDAEYKEKALEIARRSYVFPETIEIRRDRWQRACEFYYIAHALSDNNESKSLLTTQEEKKIEEIYERSVMDRVLRHITRESISKAFSDNQNEHCDKTISISRIWLCFLALSLVGGTVATSHVLESSVGLIEKITISFSWILMFFIHFLFTKKFEKFISLLLYILYTAFFVIAWWSYHELLVNNISFLGKAHFFARLPLNDIMSSTIVSCSISIICTIVSILIASVSRKNTL